MKMLQVEEWRSEGSGESKDKHYFLPPLLPPLHAKLKNKEKEEEEEAEKR